MVLGRWWGGGVKVGNAATVVLRLVAEDHKPDPMDDTDAYPSSKDAREARGVTT